MGQPRREMGEHWAYRLPQKVEVPKPFSLASLFGLSSSEISNNIDYFIQAKFEEKGLSFSDPSDNETLLRRVYLDLTGLPPSLQELNSFKADKRNNAYELRVDSLLSLQQFGEKWASWWLDMARYADTKGYEKDVARQIWSYRDWVIKALNDDMPYDQFTIEQLAGDLLPEPTKDQLLATAFHRNTMNNDEGGTDSEEFRMAAVLDRVNTTYQVWLSTTFECVQCHSHTYDPFKFEEYYKSVAFFNNTRDEDTEGDHPKLRFYNEQQQSQVDSIKTWLSKYGKEKLLKSTDLFLTSLEPKIHAHYADQLTNAIQLKPDYINCHTGKEYYSFEQNKTLILIASQKSKSSGVPIYHETHRGRFSFAAHISKVFLERIPELTLALDISHWCAVHESLLGDQKEAVNLALSRTGHIHTRVGHQQGSQVNDPSAPEWKSTLDQHLVWWDSIVETHKKQGKTQLTMCMEFGPSGYLPTLPFTQQPVADQWTINKYMLDLLKKRYSSL